MHNSLDKKFCKPLENTIITGNVPETATRTALERR